ncbi:hypothetical protein LVD13_05120 [Flavobacteriaceae bacterium D16]|nr:hypothetical protein [Flavobacteriaceae bacterium D16]
MEKNKTGKYLKYAIGEIFLVMVGILLALQVNDWNENRKINNQELELLASLHNEFTYNRNELERCIKLAQSIQNRCEKLLENTGDQEVKLSRQESNALIYYGLLSIVSFDRSNGVLDNIIYSGHINIIKNDNLRELLSNWDGILYDVKEDETWGINARNNIARPFIMKNANLVDIHEMELEGKKITSGFNTDYKAIYNSLEFENLVNSHRWWNRKNEWGYENLKETVDKIIALCEEEIRLKNK